MLTKLATFVIVSRSIYMVNYNDLNTPHTKMFITTSAQHFDKKLNGLRFKSLEFRVWVQDIGFGVQNLGVCSLGFRVKGLGFEV